MLTKDGMLAEVRIDELMLAIGSGSPGDDDHHVSLSGRVKAFQPEIPGLPLTLLPGKDATISIAVNCGPRPSREADVHPGALGRLVVRRRVDGADADADALHFTLVVHLAQAYLDRLLALRHDTLRVEPVFRRNAAPHHAADGWHLVVDQLYLSVRHVA